ncbi:MAG: InlB B-repeat-containing protein [Clostridia bacterium]|nr:InlB B-repeat-containing protein [Clostridia bacterium]
MKKIRLIFALAFMLLALLALGSCVPIIAEPIDPNTLYTVEFNTDGGSEVASQSVKRNDKVTEPKAPVKEGYDFVGWYSGKILWKFDEYTVRQDTTLVAKWQVKTYSVIFTGGYEREDGTAVLYDTSYALHGGQVTRLPKNPTRENYVFKGWTVNGRLLDLDMPILEDTVIEARWNKVCTVTFDTAGLIDIEDSKVESGKVAKAPDVSDVIGYRLVDWYAHGEVWDFNDPVEDDMTLTAVWKKVHWVSFNTNGGEVMEPYQVDDGALIEIPPIPYHSGHYFVGWYSLVDEFTLGEHDFSKPVTKNVKLEAKWIVRQDGNLVYDDQTLVKIILPDAYRDVDGQYIASLKNSIDRHLIYDSEIVSTAQHELVAKYREIVVGRSEREISVKAYEALEQMQKSDGELRYLIYVNRVEIARGVQKELSVCIAYDEDEDGLAMRLAIEAFIDAYLQNDRLSMSTGTYLKTKFDPADYQAQATASREIALIELGKREEK